MAHVLKCRRCRYILLENERELQKCSCGNIHISLEDAPHWVKEIIEEKNFNKSKLNCERCGAKVGSFDFVTAKFLCENKENNFPIYFVESKIDCDETDSKALSLLRYNKDAIRALTQNMSDRLARFHASATTSGAAAACAVDDGSAFANEAFEMGRKKVSEVAASITRRGRECVANICASVDANISAHLPEFAVERRPDEDGRSSPVTSDDETDDSVTTDVNTPTQPAALDRSTPPLESDETSLTESIAVPVQCMADLEPANIEEATLTTSDVSESKEDEIDLDSLTCSVCLEVFYLPQSCDPCDHVFCDPCLRQVNSSASGSDAKCPLCRVVIRRCVTHEELCDSVKSLFPEAYHERMKQERKKRRHRQPLPGASNPRARSSRRRASDGVHPLRMWAGVCFVLLFMMFGFTVFATTIGLVFWYLLEKSANLLVDVTLQVDTFSDVLKTSLVALARSGGYSEEALLALKDSARRVVDAFTRLVHPRNLSDYSPSSFARLSLVSDNIEKSSEMFQKLTQTNIANYVVVGCVMTFAFYKLAKYLQARRAMIENNN